MRVLIIGRHEVLYYTAELLSKEHEIVGVITAPAPGEYLKKEKDFEKLALRLNCPFLLITNKRDDIVGFVKKANPDIGISVNWTYVVNNDLIRAIPKGILNFHSGDLPKYKGNAAPNWAILLNEKEIVLTIHYMKPDEIDSGDIILKKKMRLDENETIGDIISFWCKNVPSMFRDSLRKINDKSFKPKRQIGSGFRCFPRLPIDGKIAWNKPVKELHNLIRSATQPYPGAYTFLKIKNDIKKVYIWKSRIVIGFTKDLGRPGHIIFNDVNSGESHVYCGEGILALQEVQYDDGEVFKPGKRWKSIRIRFGLDIEEELMNINKRLLKKNK